jgi:hypothetical protein
LPKLRQSQGGTRENIGKKSNNDMPQLGQAGKSRENHDGVEENTEKEEW